MILIEENVVDLDVEAINKCIDYLHSGAVTGDVGMVEIGEGIRCIVSQYNTLHESSAVWEAHKKYVDLHYVLCGVERVRVAHTSQGKPSQYSEDADYMEIEAETTAEVVLRKGTILCLFPNDAHQVKIQLQNGGECLVTKVVFKIPVELFSKPKDTRSGM